MVRLIGIGRNLLPLGLLRIGAMSAATAMPAATMLPVPTPAPPSASGFLDSKIRAPCGRGVIPTRKEIERIG